MTTKVRKTKVRTVTVTIELDEGTAQALGALLDAVASAAHPGLYELWEQLDDTVSLYGFNSDRFKLADGKVLHSSCITSFGEV